MNTLRYVETILENYPTFAGHFRSSDDTQGFAATQATILEDITNVLGWDNLMTMTHLQIYKLDAMGKKLNMVRHTYCLAAFLLPILLVACWSLAVAQVDLHASV